MYKLYKHKNSFLFQAQSLDVNVIKQDPSLKYLGTFCANKCQEIVKGLTLDFVRDFETKGQSSIKETFKGICYWNEIKTVEDLLYFKSTLFAEKCLNLSFLEISK